jgi:hypothetical protein
MSILGSVAVRGWVALLIALTAAACLAAPGARAAAQGPAQRLVEEYSPITMLAESTDPPCDNTREQFHPTTVDVMLGNPKVELVKPGDGGRVIKKGPKQEDIAGLGDGYHLDVPGDPLHAGCRYAEDFETLKKAGDAPAITYARIAREEGRSGLAVQYWFFYYFNQFNDLHEGDWEGMQVAFGADTPREALQTGPYEIALFQHEGGEKASWDDPKVEKEGNHPVVYPAAGSHATFYGPAIFVENGSGGSGLGCDNTTEPHLRMQPYPELVPTEPRTTGPYSWLTYKGHWGQKEKGYNNGPQGPMEKLQWDQPFTWMDGVRDRSPELPSGFVLGPQVTSAFCGTVKAMASLVNLDAESRPAAIAVVVGVILLLIVLVRLTRWSPVELTPLRQKRAFGQLLRAARQLYGRYWRPFVLVGLTSVPIIGAIYGLQLLSAAITHDSGVGVWIQNASTPIGYAVVAAIAIAFLRDLELGRPTGYVTAFRDMVDRFWRVVGGQILATLLVLLMALTVIGIPFAIWKYVEWQFVQQEIMFKDKRLREAFRGSTQLVRGHWWRTVRIAGVLWLISIVIGPALAFALIFTPLPLVWANLLGSLVYALLVPYVAIGRTLLYWDLATRKQEVAEGVAEPKRRRWWSRWRTSPQPG